MCGFDSQPNKDPNAEAPVDGNNEQKPSPQPPDDDAAANLAGKEAANNKQRLNTRPPAQMNRNEGNANVLTPALTILAEWNFTHASIISTFRNCSTVFNPVKYIT